MLGVYKCWLFCLSVMSEGELKEALARVGGREKFHDDYDGFEYSGIDYPLDLIRLFIKCRLGNVSNLRQPCEYFPQLFLYEDSSLTTFMIQVLCFHPTHYIDIQIPFWCFGVLDLSNPINPRVTDTRIVGFIVNIFNLISSNSYRHDDRHYIYPESVFDCIVSLKSLFYGIPQTGEECSQNLFLSLIPVQTLTFIHDFIGMFPDVAEVEEISEIPHNEQHQSRFVCRVKTRRGALYFDVIIFVKISVESTVHIRGIDQGEYNDLKSDSVPDRGGSVTRPSSPGLHQLMIQMKRLDRVLDCVSDFIK